MLNCRDLEGLTGGLCGLLDGVGVALVGDSYIRELRSKG